MSNLAENAARQFVNTDKVQTVTPGDNPISAFLKGFLGDQICYPRVDQHDVPALGQRLSIRDPEHVNAKATVERGKKTEKKTEPMRLSFPLQDSDTIVKIHVVLETSRGIVVLDEGEASASTSERTFTFRQNADSYPAGALLVVEHSNGQNHSMVIDELGKLDAPQADSDPADAPLEIENSNRQHHSMASDELGERDAPQVPPQQRKEPL